MTMRVVTLALVTTGLTLTAWPVVAQGDFHWKGKLAAGKTIEIKGVNGDIDAVAGSGDVEAQTVNGSIVASMGKAMWTDALDFQTVNGGITLELPANLSTEVKASTVNGDIETDFPLTITGRFGPRRLNGTIGNGGRRLALQTVNGSIRLRKTA